MSVLNKIIDDVKKNLFSVNRKVSSQLSFNEISFLNALKNGGKKKLHLIAELKRSSPSKGILQKEASVKEVVNLYDLHAAAISILTNYKYFGGSLEDLKEASKITTKPLLRKDFIIDPIQVHEARLHGASSYLLIAQILSSSQLQELICVGKELGMDPLIEIHNESELEHIFSCGADIEILGINNRNLNDLSIDLQITHRVLQKIPVKLKEDLVIISESGLSSKKDLDNLPNQVNAVLMGTCFMSSNNPKELIKSLFGD